MAELLQPADLEALASLVASRLAEQLRLYGQRLLTLTEVAERLQLTARGLAGLVKRGEFLEGHLIGGIRRWSWSEVEEFLRKRRGHKPRKRRRGQYTEHSDGRRRGEAKAEAEGDADA